MLLWGHANDAPVGGADGKDESCLGDEDGECVGCAVGREVRSGSKEVGEDDGGLWAGAEEEFISGLVSAVRCLTRARTGFSQAALQKVFHVIMIYVPLIVRDVYETKRLPKCLRCPPQLHRPGWILFP